MHIGVAKFQGHCFNISRDIFYSVFFHFSVANLVTNESKGPRTKMLLVYVGATDSSNQPKIKYKDNKLQG